MASKFYEEIKNALIEREVEDVYNKGINLYFPGVAITHPFACDGLIDTKTSNNKILKLIIEYKLNELLSSKSGRAKILIQVIFYLKQFEINGMLLPNVCMVGDKNECFVIHTNSLLKYLDEENVNWDIAASSAYMKYPDFVVKIANDDDINPFVFNVDENFSFNAVAQKISDLADNVQRYVHVTEHNIATIYDYFCRNVVKNIKKIKSHDLVGIFMGVITNGDDYYQHPSKKNLLVTPMGNIDINGDGFKSFFGYFQRTYTPQEKNTLTAIADRLIEDTDRRNSGDFWTPTLFVDYAHKMISEQLGENWKDEYVVWDNCCGSKNLTRDYKFKELYCSTLFDSELNIGERYNKEATSFQFDFLNDYIPMPGELIQSDTKIPEGLLNAFKENKKIVFFLNPPYGKATGAGGKLDAGTSDTKVKEQMKKEGIEGSEFIKQFLYNISDIKRNYYLTNCYIVCFTKPSWLIKPQSEKFRKLFFEHFNYKDGIMFQASEFADCSNLWGITFNIWKSENCVERNNFNHNLIQNDNGEIKVFGEKVLYNFDNCQVITTSNFVTNRLIKKHKKSIICCDNIKEMKFSLNDCNVFDNYISDIRVVANDISANEWTCITNVKPISGCGHLQCTKDNIFDSCIVQAIRTIIPDTWIVDKDMYNMNVEIPNEFKLDSFIYSIFTNYCCGIRLEDGSQLVNEFCWYDMNKVKELANQYGLDETYQDSLTTNQRFVYTLIQQHQNEFSVEALDLLNKANEIVYKSFKYRSLFNDEHPEVQIIRCDCGFYQLKQLWMEYMKDEYNEFRYLYKKLVEKLRSQVYEIGFLKK